MDCDVIHVINPPCSIRKMDLTFSHDVRNKKNVRQS